MLQFWSAIVLLVFRLLFGEVVHAMPHDDGAASHEIAPVSESGQPCPDHDGVHDNGDDGAPPSPQAPGAGYDADSDDMDCCETGICKCPCAHISAFTAPTPPGSVAPIDQSPAVQCAAGCMHRRLTALFRPPA